MHCPPRPPDPLPPPRPRPARGRLLPSSSPAVSQPLSPAPHPSPARPVRPLQRFSLSAPPCLRCVRPTPATDEAPEAAPRRKRTTRLHALALLAAIGAPAEALASPLPTPPADPRDSFAPSARETGRAEWAVLPSAAGDTAAWGEGWPAAAPTRRRRAVVPRYSWVEGRWVEDYGWTLRGRGTSAPSSTLGAHQGAETDAVGVDAGHARYRTSLAPALEDNLPSSTQTVASSPSPTSPHTALSSSDTLHAADLAATPSGSAAASNASASSASISIPDGWQAKPRETDYYAVPIIISMSVLVAVIVVVSILVSVLMRRKKRRRSCRRSGKKHKEGEGEKGWRGMVDKAMKPVRGVGKKGRKRARDEHPPVSGGDAPEGGNMITRRRVRTNGFAAGPRVRPRRRRRRDDGVDGDDDDEGTALTRTGTRSSTSSIAHDTLTARLSARSHPSHTGATTVFSRDVPSRSQVSLTASALSRVSSRTSQRSSLGAPAPPLPEVLFTPADDPTLTEHLPIPGSSSSSLRRERSASNPVPAPMPAPLPPSAFGILITTTALPAPGPPAYRPSSTTLQSTRRYGAGDAVAPGAGASAPQRERPARGRFGRRREAQEVGEQEEEGEWHWPGEKGRLLGGTAIAGPSSPPTEPEDGMPEEDQPAEVDRALYAAHIATDDKAVLARLRAQRDSPSSAFAPSAPISSSVPAPSAPLDTDDADVDEDGFERLDADTPPASAPPPASLVEDDEYENAALARAPPATSFLPAPPKPVQQPSFAYAYARSTGGNTPSAPLTPSSTAPLLASSPACSRKAALAAEYGAADADTDDDGVDALPRYLAGGAAGREALELATAPLTLESDEEEDELEYAEMGAAHRNEGDREDEGVV
ncbi:hypothetical protein JCM3770_004171 [Rhodotorula araucariae]